MKKEIVFFLLLIVLIAFGCQKKEEPKSELPAGSIQSEAEISALKEAVRKEPKNVEGWIKLGNILMDSSRFNEAVEAYQKALDIDPKNVDVRVDMGTCYRKSGKPDVAVAEYKKALDINPNHLLAIKNMGIVLEYDLNDGKQAIQYYEKYIQAAPYAEDAGRVKEEIAKLKAK